MDLGLDGRVALVTGSWRGTGAGVARVLAAEGATVLVHGLEQGQTDDTVASIADGRWRAPTRCTATSAPTWAPLELVASVQAATDRVDILVNNYGVADGTTWDGSDGPSWHDSYDTNVVSAIRVTNALVPGMRTHGWGRIVFVATVGATRPGDRIPEYYAAKGALPSVTVSLAKHLAGTGITVNCVSPGVIATPEMVESFTPSGRGRGSRHATGRRWSGW